MDPLTSYTPPPLSATYTAGVQPGSSVAQSYSNPGGSGPRGSLITATNSAFFTTGTAASLVDGATGNVAYFSGASASGNYLRFDFGAARKITEAKWYQSTADSHGTWKWQGSQDASSWTDIGSSFTLGGATTQTQTQLNGNSTAYRYYQLLGVSGTTSNGSWITEIEFKIDDASALNLSSLSVSGLAQFQGLMQLMQTPVWPPQTGSYVWCTPAVGGVPAFRYLTRADIGSLALTPSDIPARRTLIATLASQTLAGGYNRLAFASATRNDGLFTVSSNVFTAVANCVVQVSWAMYSAGSAQVNPVVRKNASNYIQASPSQISAGCYASIPVELSTGDTLEVYAYSDTGSIDLDISIAALNKLIIVEA